MNGWQYEPAADLDQTLIERLRRFPREPDMLVYGLRTAAAVALRGWMKIYHRLEIAGRENLPAHSSFVLVANHASHLDALCLLSALPLGRIHRAFPAAAVDYFFASVPRTAVAAVFINALPFNRELHLRQSLGLCQALLNNPGNILILFPEGTRSATGAMGPFKPGLGMMLAGWDVPVVPCNLEGTYRALRKGRWLPRPGKIRLTIGTPCSFANRPRGKTSAVAVCQELQTAVTELAHRRQAGIPAAGGTAAAHTEAISPGMGPS